MGKKTERKVILEIEYTDKPVNLGRAVWLIIQEMQLLEEEKK